jgi:hypothetical protein
MAAPPPEADDRLDWRGHGLSARARHVARAAAEALLADEDGAGHLVACPEKTLDRAVEALDRAVFRGSADVRRGFGVLSFALEWLPIFVIGAPSRMSQLSLGRRVHYLEALESSRIGLLAMLMVAFKVPLCIPAFEEPEELARTGFDRPSTTARRALPVLARDAAP